MSYRTADGAAHEVDLASAITADLVGALPWGAFRWHRGHEHYSGAYWSASTGSHVIYESRLELSRLTLADFDPRTVRIAAQPFLLDHDGRRHVPDYPLTDVDGAVAVVNVKPAERMKEPKVKEALRWAGALFGSGGWRSEVCQGPTPVAMANVRFLAGYRRQATMDPAVPAVRDRPSLAGRVFRRPRRAHRREPALAGNRTERAPTPRA